MSLPTQVQPPYLQSPPGYQRIHFTSVSLVLDDSMISIASTSTPNTCFLSTASVPRVAEHKLFPAYRSLLFRRKTDDRYTLRHRRLLPGSEYADALVVAIIISLY
jgi:hypothetical protein